MVQLVRMLLSKLVENEMIDSCKEQINSVLKQLEAQKKRERSFIYGNMMWVCLFIITVFSRFAYLNHACLLL